MKEKKSYKIIEISSNTYRIEDSFQDQMYCIVGKEKAVLIDTGIGESGLKETVRSITSLPIMVVNTHGHIDHIGTNDEFDTCYLHEKDRKVAKEHFSGLYPASIISGLGEELGLNLKHSDLEDLLRKKKEKQWKSIEDGTIISLGGRTLEVIHLPGHTNGSIGVLEKETGLLFIGDTICSARVMLSFPHSTNVSQFLSSMQKLKQRQSQIRSIYAGHPQIPITPEYIDRYIECGEKLLKSDAGAIKETSVFGEFYVFHDKDISITYTTDKLY